MSNEKTDLARREFDEVSDYNDTRRKGVYVYNPVNVTTPEITINMPEINIEMPAVNVVVNVSDQKTSTRTEENSSTTNPSLGDVGGFISTLLSLIDK